MKVKIRPWGWVVTWGTLVRSNELMLDKVYPLKGRKHGAKSTRYNILSWHELIQADTHTHTYIYILNILSSRQNPLHLSSYYFHLFSVIACWVAISFSSILCHYRFWRGHYRFTVFRAHLWQKCFCNTRVVFNDFDSNSYNIYICISLCACVII